MIPNDPFMLLSFINTKLRDEYSDLEALSDGLDIDVNEVKEKLSGIGYTYDRSINQFK